MLGACLKDKVYIDWATKTIFPNFPLLIVAPSGWGKTGAVNSCMSIFEGLLPYVIPEDCTAESFMRQFASISKAEDFSTQALWVVPELADIFGKKKYQEGLIARITRILDAPKNRKVARSGDDKVQVINGYAVFNWISCTTFTWLAESVEESASTGGFLPRLFVVNTSDPPRRNTNPQRDHIQEQNLHNELSGILSKIHRYPLLITKDVEAVLEKNYLEHMKAIGTDLENAIARRDENFLRIYLVLRTFGGINDLTELLRLSYGSCKYFEYNNLNIIKQLNNSKNRNNKFSQKNYDRVIGTLRKTVRAEKNELIYSKLCRSLDLHSDELRNILNDLQQKSYIEWDGKTGDSGVIHILDILNHH